MPSSAHVPHIELLLRGMRITRERLHSRSKVAVDAKILRALIRAAVHQSAFDAEFYLATYPDVAEAHRAGTVTDLHEHYVETGFFEGRVGAPGEVDELFYVTEYPDVAQAVQAGEVRTASEHYVRSGAAEGRLPNPGLKPEIDAWTQVLREHTF